MKLMQCEIFIINCNILLEPSQIYRLFITRKEDILSFSTDIKENENGHARESTDTFSVYFMYQNIEMKR